jgi:hypothetical protein
MSPTRPQGTTSRHAVRSRAGLPGPVCSSSGLTAAERLVFTAVVPLLSIPLLLATMGATWVAAGAAAATAFVAWVSLARRVVIGSGWIADRRLVGYRVTYGTDLVTTDVVQNGHGGIVRLRPRQGRAYRLREPGFGSVQARLALSTAVTAQAGRLPSSAAATSGTSCGPVAAACRPDRDAAA